MCPIHEDVEPVSICCGAPIVWERCGKCRENTAAECPSCWDEEK